MTKKVPLSYELPRHCQGLSRIDASANIPQTPNHAEASQTDYFPFGLIAKVCHRQCGQRPPLALIKTCLAKLEIIYVL